MKNLKRFLMIGIPILVIGASTVIAFAAFSHARIPAENPAAVSANTASSELAESSDGLLDYETENTAETPVALGLSNNDQECADCDGDCTGNALCDSGNECGNGRHGQNRNHEQSVCDGTCTEEHLYGSQCTDENCLAD